MNIYANLGQVRSFNVMLFQFISRKAILGLVMSGYFRLCHIIAGYARLWHVRSRKVM
jgi:hypothetical protein